MTRSIYFLGIGGIGMSALARYFLHEGRKVGGYDRTPSDITRRLEAEGAEIHYEDSTDLIPEAFRNPDGTIVVYTPAIPADMGELVHFRTGGFEVMKRSQMLGILSEGKYVMAVAGTHGKTTTSTLIAWLNHTVYNAGSGFLGGISRNFSSNLVLGAGSRLAVEADEFDRSFLRLNPDVAVITAADADHLDIYGTVEAVREAFSQFVERIRPGGALVMKKGVDIKLRNDDISVYRYSYDSECDFHAESIRLAEGGYYDFDIVTPDRTIRSCRTGIPGWVNVENTVAAVAAMWCAARARGEALDEDLLRRGLESYRGVKRRFEFWVNTPHAVYMDDYAHHPEELRSAITSVRGMFPGRHLTAVFQPHLYTRTRDLCTQFAESLSLSDRVILLPIYPAREEPISGVDSRLIGRDVTAECLYSTREELCSAIGEMETDIVVTFGAGNIDAVCEPLSRIIGAKARG